MALTKSEIKYKIDTLTWEKNNCIGTRDNYKKSLSYANKLVSNLKSGISYLNTTKDHMKKNFTINGKTADGGKIEKTATNVNGIVKKLNNTIIPRINQEINSLNNEINNLTYRINSLWNDYYNAKS